ncbi:MAG TPA: 3-dehydroquinate synthase [Chthoniobacteraceae bacterium]|nr:3-dehydroquinate synthase [Chthoniobacteraceae bacterium]
MNREVAPPETVEVALGSRSYHVKIGTGLLEATGPLAREHGLGRRCAVVTDAHVGPLYAGPVLDSLRQAGFEPTLVTVPAGEASKAMSVAEEVCDAMIAAGLDRKGWVVALGGGVVGDLAGFVAAIYYRGVPFVQIPTTVVAQVDSAVGGKTGVNARKGKNLIGAFHQPRLVLADVATLQSLPPREWNEGFAEIIKHAVIRDRSLLDTLHGKDLQHEPARVAAIIRRNVAIKAAIVSADEHETTGERALLNFGHTIGHGIENAAGYGELLHGEAISLGLIAACRLSMRKAGLSPEENERVLQALAAFSLPLRLPESIGTCDIMDALKKDKKFSEGAIRFVLTPCLGEAFVSADVTVEEIREAVEALR